MRWFGISAPDDLFKQAIEPEIWPTSLTFRLSGFATGSLLILTLAAQTLGQIPAQFAKHSQPVTAQTSTSSGPNDGVLRRYKNFQVETSISESGIQIRLTTSGVKQALAQNCRGVVMLKVAGESKRYRYDLLPRNGELLEAQTNLSRIAGKQVEVSVLLVSLPTSLVSEGRLKYREVITLAPNSVQLAASAIARQSVCPVSGKRLGSMGNPLPVSVGEQTIFVCCSGCVSALKNNPLKFASGRPEIIVSTATSSDAAGIAKQRVCPVMNEPLGGMGQPIKVMVGDKPIYLCCKGCVKKIEQEPLKYLGMVHGNAEISQIPSDSIPSLETAKTNQSATSAFVTFREEQVRDGIFKVSVIDKPFVTAQKRCPVMDEPLDAMGGPYKVNAAGQAIYICCPGCAKRIASDPRKYLDILKDQGIHAPLIR